MASTPVNSALVRPVRFYKFVNRSQRFVFIPCYFRDKERESLAASTSTKFFLHNQSTFHHNVGEKVAQVCIKLSWRK